VEDSPPTSDEQKRRRPSLQFRLRTLLWITVAWAGVLGTLRWLGVRSEAILVVVLVLGASTAAAVGLAVALAASAADREDNGSTLP